MIEILVLAAMIAVYEFERRFARRIAELSAQYEAKVAASSPLARRATLDPIAPANDNARITRLDPVTTWPHDAETQPPTSAVHRTRALQAVQPVTYAARPKSRARGAA